MEHRHPIRVAVKRTGISPHLIRMWEKRYSAVTPQRTETGRRLYTDKDIERLVLLRRATMEGQTIGQIARLSADRLRELIPAETSDDQTPINSDSIENHLKLALQAIENLDAVQLETRLLRASVNLGQQVFIEKLLHPLLELTGEGWSDGRLSVAHEHLASAVVRSLLGSMHLSGATGEPRPLLVSTTPSGQLHEFGALMALVSASTDGWRTLYLGPNLPAEDIVRAVEDRKASAIALSLVYPADDPELIVQLRKLRQMAPVGIPLLVGGRSAIAYDQVLDEIGAVRIGQLVNLRKELNRLKQSFDSSSPSMGAKKA